MSTLERLLLWCEGEKQLYFRFLPGLSGISYNLVKNSAVLEFMRTSSLVRDRSRLSKSNVWNEHKELFFERRFIVDLDDTLFLCSPRVWSPSVDAVFMYERMIQEDVVRSSSSLMDIGCGTGAVSISIANKLKQITHLFAEDINSEALSLFAINAQVNTLEAIYTLSKGFENHIPEAEIAIGTPYYFPVKRQSKLSPDEEISDAVQATAYIITRSMDIASKAAYFVYSSVTEDAVRKQVGRSWEVIDSLEVPFTIGDNVGNSRVVEKALRLGLLREGKGLFPYYHTIFLGRKMK